MGIYARIVTSPGDQLPVAKTAVAAAAAASGWWASFARRAGEITGLWEYIVGRDGAIVEEIFFHFGECGDDDGEVVRI